MKAIVNGQANSASGIDFVIEALHEINLGKYSDLFRLNGFDEYVLEQANHDMLKETGIISSIDRQGWIGYAGTHVPMFVHKLGLIKPRQT